MTIKEIMISLCELLEDKTELNPTAQKAKILLHINRSITEILDEVVPLGQFVDSEWRDGYIACRKEILYRIKKIKGE